MAFTYKYSQPSEYHYSLDSVLAANFVAQQLKIKFKNIESSVADNFQVLDLCAGCGVMGFELSWHCSELKKIDFLEVQTVYEEHLKSNINTVNRADVLFQYYLMNYADVLTESSEKKNGPLTWNKIGWKNKYDLIICNPPYFRPEQGSLSASEFKKRCRFYIDSNFEKLILSIVYMLKHTGVAYLLLRPLKSHGWDTFEELKNMLQDHELKLSAKIIADIRGTALVQISFD